MSACPLPNEEERDNFFCLTCLLFDIGKKTLQTNFKKTWPLVNGTEAAWSDVPDDGAQLLALCDGLEIEDHEKNVIQKGDSTDWNLALVNKVLMHSRFRATQGSVVPDSQEYKGLDEIKGISRTLMSHVKEKVLPNSEFLAVWKKASDILEKFGATNEEIAAIQKDMERTRKEAEQYLQRLFPFEQNEKELVKSDQTETQREIRSEGAVYSSIAEIATDSYFHTKSARSEKKDMTYDQLLPSYKKTVMRGEWKPRPLSEVVTSKIEGLNEEEWSAKTFLSAPDDYLARMISSGSDTKLKVEQMFVQEILPFLETELRKSHVHSEEMYQILAKLGCCGESQKTVKHSLHLLRHLLTKDRLGKNNARTILKVERILRGSFSPKEGLFKDENSDEKGLRLSVYSQVLCLLAISLANEFFTELEDQDHEELSILHRNLKKRFSGKVYKRKDKLQHEAELIIAALKWLIAGKKSTDQLKHVLQCFKDLPSKDNCMPPLETGVLAKKLSSYGGFCLHVILRCIEHEIRENRNALNLLLNIVESVKSKGNHDWQFFIAISGILTNATMSNRHGDIRVEAGWKLIEYLQGAEVSFKKSPELKTAVEESRSRALFSPDRPVRDSLAKRFNAASKEDISAEKIMNYLCWFYRSQAIERKKIVKETSHKVVYHGLFRGAKVAVKIMKPIVHALDSSESKEAAQIIESGFVTESYFLRRLNEVANHPHILHLLCCNTVRVPFHVITTYSPKGNLLEYLRKDCRSEATMRELSNLSQWCLEVLDALVFLSKHNIVHKRIMARSVLLNEKEVCQLGGFSAAEEMKEQESHDHYMNPFPEVRLDVPRIVRWLAPEVLRYGHYSKASDVWAFGVFMHEVFSFGCEPFRPMSNGRPIDDDCQVLELTLSDQHLPKFLCFDERVYKLMERCWSLLPSQRGPPEQLRGDLLSLQLQFMEIDADLPAKPPPVFPEIGPRNEEEARKKTEELRAVLRSQRKPPMNVVSAERKAKVRFAYKAQREFELNLEVDDIVDVLDREKRDWWMVRLGDNTGFVKSSYVELLDMRGGGEQGREKNEREPHCADTYDVPSKHDEECWDSTTHKTAPVFQSNLSDALHEKETAQAKDRKEKLQGGENDGRGSQFEVTYDVPSKHDDECWESRTYVNVSHAVKKKDTVQAKDSTDKKQVSGRRAKVVFDFNAREDDELSIELGETVEIFSEVSEEWWEGRLHDNTGIFPSNHVELLGETTAQAKGIPEEDRVTGRKAKVMFDFKAEQDDELSLKVDEIIAIHREVSEEWWEGRLHNNTGIFPSNHVQLLEEAKLQANENPQTHRVAGGRAKVVCDFKVGKGDELSLKVDEIVEVIEEVSEEWWKGRLHDNSGSFPSNHVELLAEAIKQTKEITEENRVPRRRAKVVFDYKAGDEDELNLKVHEIVEILGVSREWWEGRLHDNTGIFPSNHVELLEEAKAQAKEITEENRVAGRKAKVMFDFKAEDDGELSLKVDEIVELLEVSEAWWEGRLHNITGIFPSNYVELLEENRVPCRRAKVVFDYKAGDDDELNLKVGEIVEILAEASEEWWEGRLHNNTGMFPSDFVELLEEKTVQAKEVPEENQARGKEEHEYDDIVSVLRSCDSELREAYV